MSYDLKLFKIPQDIEPRHAYEQLMAREEAELLTSDGGSKQPLPDSRRAAMQHLADAVAKCWPAFVPFHPASQHPFIEMNDENLEIHLAIYEQTASITLPYFRQRGEEKMRCIECCLKTCWKERGYAAYNPQLGRLVSLGELEKAAKEYRGMDQAFSGIRGNMSDGKPWWKFW